MGYPLHQNLRNGVPCSFISIGLKMVEYIDRTVKKTKTQHQNTTNFKLHYVKDILSNPKFGS
ncbi:MAG: hypothetical protein EA409_04865 [Saprospirales bacterium]|nr:MAG: hypothetical protein EA409_04865 [Saprospirales bacterium]